MLRPKLQYNKSDIQENLYTDGQQWMTEDGTEYVGLYHTYSDGTVLTLPVYDATLSKKLIPFKPSQQLLSRYTDLKSNIKTDYMVPIPYSSTPTPIDIRTGVMVRYFIERYDSIIFEISSETYDAYDKKQIDPNLYKSVKLDWTIKGSLVNTTINGILYPSVETLNRKSVLIAARTCPNIIQLITNFTEFAIIGSIVIPDDINA